MAIPKMTDDLNIIQALSDLPNSEDGLTADELKAKFDKAALAIQDYLNNTLTPALIATQIPFAKTTAINADTIQAAIENVQEQIREASTGTIVNGAVTKEKLAAELLARVYGGIPWVSAGTPGSGDNPETDFPLGQVWLRPTFTVVNEAGDAWTGSGCTAEKSEYDVILTGSAQAASVTATQNMTGLGNQGDRVLILFAIQNQDSEITGITASVNGGTEQAISGNVTLAGSLSSGGTLSLQLTVTWPSASLASGSVTMGCYTVVNLDRIMRQIDGAKEVADWEAYLWSLLPFYSYTSPEAVFIQHMAGSWFQIAFDVLPVSRGGTGLSSLPAGKYWKNEADGTPGFLSKEDVIEDLGSLRLQTGTYTGSGEARTVELPVKPKILVIYAQSGPDTSNLSDHSILLGDGATELEKNSASVGGSTLSYYSIVSLSGNALTFRTNPSTLSGGPPSYITVTPDCCYGNRSGETYSWVAVY